ncbi:MAG: hypothetical protein AAF215_03185 [Cyanobacteria bacterium P01_A01_bin.123]
MAKAAAQTSYDPYIAKLIEFSNRRAKEDSARSRHSTNRNLVSAQTAPMMPAITLRPLNRAGSKVHADPISPLRTQDWVALDDLFAHDQMTVAEPDILQNLDKLCPEPCWEEDPYEFLHGYL